MQCSMRAACAENWSLILCFSPAMQTMIDNSFVDVYASPSRRHDRPKVNKLEVDDKMVFDVTFVRDKLRLKVSWAPNHKGSTCNARTSEIPRDPLQLLKLHVWFAHCQGSASKAK